MRVRIFISSGETSEYEVLDGSDVRCYELPPKADRFAYWRGVTGDERIQGHAMVWEVVR